MRRCRTLNTELSASASRRIAAACQARPSRPSVRILPPFLLPPLPPLPPSRGSPYLFSVYPPAASTPPSLSLPLSSPSRPLPHPLLPSPSLSLPSPSLSLPSHPLPPPLPLPPLSDGDLACISIVLSHSLCPATSPPPRLSPSLPLPSPSLFVSPTPIAVSPITMQVVRKRIAAQP